MLFRLKIQIIFIYALFSVGSIHSQNDTILLTLKEAQQLAIENDVSYKTLLLNHQIADKQLSLAWAQLYPQVQVGMDLRYNIERPISLLPGETVGRPGEVVIAKLGSDFGGAPVVELKQIVFDASLFSEFKIIKESEKANTLEKEISIKEIKTFIAKAYFNCFIHQERIKQLQLAENRLKSTLTQIQIKIQANLLPSIEEERIQLAIQNAQSNFIKANQTLFLEKALLKYTIGLPQNQPMKLVNQFESINDLDADFATLSIQPFDLSHLPKIQLQNHQIQLSKLKIEQQQKTHLPTVSFYGNMGIIALSKKYQSGSDQNLSWHFNSYIGIRANWRLNNFIDNRHILPQLELKRQQAELQLKEQKRLANIEVTRANGKLANALEDYHIHKQKAVFAKKELDYLEIRFRNDLVTSKEVLAAEETLVESQQALLVAYYNYLSARFELMMLNNT